MRRTRLTNPARIMLLLFAICALITGSAFSQTDKFSSPAALAEKIYLQLDNQAYTNDQTIWFKALVTDAIGFAPTVLSGVLYVELIDANERIIEKKLVKIDQGNGNSFFQLNQQYAEGLYQVRAYTQWSKNFGPDFYFTTYIQVFAASDVTKKQAINNVRLIEEQNNQRRLSASFDPNAIDSLHTKDLTIFVSVDGKKDTLSVRKSQSNFYLLDYPLPEAAQLVTVQVHTKNNFNAGRTIILDKHYPDLQFFPESGELVQGLPGLLGVKAMDINGKGKLLEGEIIDGQGRVLTSFKTNALGMTSVALPGPVDSAAHYEARVKSTTANGLLKMYPLPRVVPQGNILSVVKDADNIRLKAISNYLSDDSVLIQVSCRGVVYFDIKGRLKAGVLRFELAADQLPAGVTSFTLLKDSASPLAERLYFNDRPESRVNIAINADKQSYLQREMTSLNVITTNSEGQPVAGNVSLLVINQTQTGQVQADKQNILSYFLLSSDLKGRIADPGYYFEKDSSRHNDLDALLLTQGWRRYLYTREPITTRFEPEPALTISGTVKGGLLVRKKKKEIGLTLMSFGPGKGVQTQVSDSLGRFSFNIHNESGDRMNVIIQSSTKTGDKKDYLISLDAMESPGILFDQVKSAEEPDSIVQAYVRKNRAQKKAADAFRNASEGITLDEVILKSYPLTPERKNVIDQYGKPKFIIEGKDIREKEAKWSYGLYSVLLFNYPDKVNIVRRPDGNLYARLYNNEVTLVVIDGIPVRADDYPLIPSIPPSEVSSFEIIEYAKSFTGLYCDVFPLGCVNAPAWGNVIAIYTYGKKGLFGANRPVGIVNTSVPVFATPREFYAPKYDQLTPAESLKPDFRTTVYWAPALTTGSTGKVVTSFYNADNTGRLQVIAEAITPNGEIGYQEIYYEVKNKN